VPEDWRKANVSCLQEGLRELQAAQLHLNPWEGDGAPNPGNHFQAREAQETPQEQSALKRLGYV